MGRSKSRKPTLMALFFYVSIGYALMTRRLELIFMKIGYVRVSTSEQNTLRQEVMMKELGVDEIYIDKMSGKNTNRPQLSNA